MVKRELLVTIEGLKAQVNIQKCEFKFMSYEYRSVSSNSRVLSSTPRVQIRVQESFNQ